MGEKRAQACLPGLRSFYVTVCAEHTLYLISDASLQVSSIENR